MRMQMYEQKKLVKCVLIVLDFQKTMFVYFETDQHARGQSVVVSCN